jgi:broad specificity phosphatase PhoE
MGRMLLVRHGQSEWNASGRWQGQADPALTDFGRQQATHAADSIGAMDVIVASTLGRAMETAAILAQRLGIGPVLTDDDLRERNAGDFAGLTRAEIDEQFPGFLEAGKRPDGWEPDELLIERGLAALGRVSDLIGDGDGLVVTHGGLITAIEQHLGADRERLANLGGRWLTTDNGLGLGDRLDLLSGAELTVPDVPGQI